MRIIKLNGFIELNVLEYTKYSISDDIKLKNPGTINFNNKFVGFFGNFNIEQTTAINQCYPLDSKTLEPVRVALNPLEEVNIIDLVLITKKEKIALSKIIKSELGINSFDTFY